MFIREWAEEPLDRGVRKTSWIVKKMKKEIRKWRVRRLNRLKQEHEVSINELNERIRKQSNVKRK